VCSPLSTIREKDRHWKYDGRIVHPDQGKGYLLIAVSRWTSWNWLSVIRHHAGDPSNCNPPPLTQEALAAIYADNRASIQYPVVLNQSAAHSA